MEQLKQHMWLAATLAMSLPLSLSAAADGNNADGNKPNPTLESVQRALLNRISELEGKINVLDGKVNTLTTVAAKRGVATLQIVPRASGKVSNSNHYFSPRYFVMGSTIKGFHDTVAFGTEIFPTNSNNHTLPEGSYMFELQQPRPPDTSPPSGAVRGERNVRQRGDRDGVTLDDGPLSPLGIPEAGLLSKPEKPQKKVGNRARSWWDDVERWRYDEEARPDLRGRDFGDADLGFVDLANADLRRADLEDANLNRANLSGANLQEAVIKRTYLYGTVMRNAVLRGTEIGPANISAADLQEADLRDLRISCRNCSTQSLLMSSNFNGADLRKAHLGASNIHRSAFDGADLRGANLAETEGVPRSLRGALYNRHTRLPEHIDPEKWGMIYVADDDPAS